VVYEFRDKNHFDTSVTLIVQILKVCHVAIYIYIYIKK
jgi:hypothetical protein